MFCRKIPIQKWDFGKFAFEDHLLKNHKQFGEKQNSNSRENAALFLNLEYVPWLLLRLLKFTSAFKSLLICVVKSFYEADQCLAQIGRKFLFS